MQKRQRKKLLKLTLQYESQKYPQLMCVICSISHKQLVCSQTLTQSHRSTVPLENKNEHISNLHIKLYTVGCYQQLVQYHFSQEELLLGENVIESTEYYIRIKREDVTDCIVVFGFVYEVVEEVGCGRLEAKFIAALGNTKNRSNYYHFITHANQDQYQNSYLQHNSSFDSKNNSYNERKYKQVLGIIQCHQIAKRTTILLAQNAVTSYLTQQQNQKQKAKQAEQRQKIALQKIYKKLSSRKYGNMSTRCIKSTNISAGTVGSTSTGRLFALSYKYMAAIGATNNRIDGQLTTSKSQINNGKCVGLERRIGSRRQKIEQNGGFNITEIKQQNIKQKQTNLNTRKKRTTIQQTIDNNFVALSNSLNPNFHKKQVQQRQLRWNCDISSDDQIKNNETLAMKVKSRMDKSIDKHIHDSSTNQSNIVNDNDNQNEYIQEERTKQRLLKSINKPLKLQKILAFHKKTRHCLQNTERITVGPLRSAQSKKPYYTRFEQYSGHNLSRLINKTHMYDQSLPLGLGFAFASGINKINRNQLQKTYRVKINTLNSKQNKNKNGNGNRKQKESKSSNKQYPVKNVKTLKVKHIKNIQSKLQATTLKIR